MSQNFQQIGQAAPEIEAVAARRQGWMGQPVTPDQVDELVGDPDFSFRARRANYQALGFPKPGGAGGIPTMAGYDQGSMAEQDPEPWEALAPENRS